MLSNWKSPNLPFWQWSTCSGLLIWQLAVGRDSNGRAWDEGTNGPGHKSCYDLFPFFGPINKFVKYKARLKAVNDINPHWESLQNDLIYSSVIRWQVLKLDKQKNPYLWSIICICSYLELVGLKLGSAGCLTSILSLHQNYIFNSIFPRSLMNSWSHEEKWKIRFQKQI